MRNYIGYMLFLWWFMVLTPNYGQHLKIGLFETLSIQNMALSGQQGAYRILHQNQILDTLQAGDIYYVTFLDSMVQLQGLAGQVYTGTHFSFQGISGQDKYQIKPVLPSEKSRSYDDNLEINIAFNRMQLLNHIDIDKYIAGVVEAEGGSTAPYEYYKAQALLCRTYAIKNMVRHGGEGFNLCDDVHCQTYKGSNRMNASILKAANETHGEVIVDADTNLISAVYHANSGGQTVSADFVWLTTKPYLQPVKDPWSINHYTATWKKEIDLDVWKNYLVKNHIPLSGKEKANDFVYNQHKRQKEYQFKHQSIFFSTIRKDLDLPSAWFSIEKINNQTLLFDGRGYGHGIGMSQIGAMEMARKGHDYMKIIDFYYNEVMIIKINNL